MRRRIEGMEVSVTIQLSLEPKIKHAAQMRSVARSLTDDPRSVRIICPPGSPKHISARFTVPDAREADVVNRIGRGFWQVEDYEDSTIGFSRSVRRTRRSAKLDAAGNAKELEVLLREAGPARPMTAERKARIYGDLKR
jgi:hypothetical protein